MRFNKEGERRERNQASLRNLLSNDYFTIPHLESNHSVSLYKASIPFLVVNKHADSVRLSFLKADYYVTIARQSKHASE